MAASRTPDWDSLLLQSHDLVRAVSERQPSGCLAQLSHGWVNTLTGRDGAIWLQPGLLQSLRARLPLPPPKAPATPTPPSPPSLQDQPLPRVQRDIRQVEQYSQTLRSRAAGGDATADTLEASRLPYILEAFSDCSSICRYNKYCDLFQDKRTPPADPRAYNAFIGGYLDFLVQLLHRTVVRPLSIQIETDLRLHSHAKTLSHMRAVNPKAASQARDAGALGDQPPGQQGGSQSAEAGTGSEQDEVSLLKPFLECPPMRCVGAQLDIRAEVSRYLDATFYNLTTSTSSSLIYSLHAF